MRRLEIVRAGSHNVAAYSIIAAPSLEISRRLKPSETGWDDLGHNCWVKSWVNFRAQFLYRN